MHGSLIAREDLMDKHGAGSDSMKSMDAIIGHQMKYIRQVFKKTQKDVAEHLGISFQQLQKYETGYNKISASRLLKVAQYYNIDIKYFYNLDDSLSRNQSTPVTLSLKEIRLVQAFNSIADEELKESTFQLVRAASSVK